ncbi:MAG: response regulator, partial [Anaerolineales bacterium]|nr:response regulator [Anaerolineales bacterium]
MMTSKVRILLVESNPDISDLIARQSLEPLGYQVITVSDVSAAIRETVNSSPAMVIANFNLPGLSGKDLLVALKAQGIDVPIIIVAEKGQEHDVMQSLRLGASDYLLWPVREAEVVSAVERALMQVQGERERKQLAQWLKVANQELQQKVDELTTMLAIGKAVVSVTDQRILFDKIVDGAVRVTKADIGWLLLRDDQQDNFVLAAHRNLPKAWAKKIGQPLDDGVSALVAVSGETLTIQGEALKRFKIAFLGKSAAVIPVKVKQKVIGLLLIVRKKKTEFGAIEQTLLEAISDYASISLVNSQLFRVLQKTADAAKAGEKGIEPGGALGTVHGIYPLHPESLGPGIGRDGLFQLALGQRGEGVEEGHDEHGCQG